MAKVCSWLEIYFENRNAFVTKNKASYTIFLTNSAIYIQDIVLSHVRNVYLGRRNFHYLMSGLVLDDAWVPDVAEYYAVNITGLRLVSPEKRKVKKILNEWKKLDKKKYKVIPVNLIMNLWIPNVKTLFIWYQFIY